MFSPRYGGMGGQMPRPVDGLAVIVSIAGAIFFAPYIWPAIEQPTLNWLYSLYGSDLAVLIGLGIMISTYPMTYFAIRMGISAIYTSLMMFIGTRLL